MADDTRRRVIYLLRAKEMTVSQIASELQKTPQGIYHHIRKLLDAGLVEVAKEERVDHFIETYYRATAEVFEFIHGEGGSEKYGEQRTREALQALKQLGIDARADDEIIERLLKISKQMNELALTPEMEERIESRRTRLHRKETRRRLSQSAHDERQAVRGVAELRENQKKPPKVRSLGTHSGPSAEPQAKFRPLQR